MRKVIIGYDGSAPAEDALALGAMLAELLDARPVIAMAVRPPHVRLGSGAHGAAEADQVLARAAERLAALSPETRMLAARSVAEELVALAEQERAALAVVGSSHRGEAGRVLLGSVGASLIQGAPCAVAVAPLTLAHGDPKLLRVGVAFDGSAEAWAALETAIGIAQRSHARLMIATVAEYPHYGLGSAAAVLSTEEVVDAERRDKRRTLGLGLARVPADLPVESRLVTGPAARLLREAATDLDLLVVGSRGHGPIGRALLGSVSTGLIHSAPCSVLVLPRAAGMDPLSVATARVGPTAAAQAAHV